VEEEGGDALCRHWLILRCVTIASNFHSWFLIGIKKHVTSMAGLGQGCRMIL